MQCITTSFIDNNYYVINNNDPQLFYLITILTEKQNEIAYPNKLMEFWSDTRNCKKNLFVDKNTSFGQTLTKLIEQKKLSDENTILRKEKIINALIQINLTDNYNIELQQIINELIKENIKHKNINDLKEKYDLAILKQIITLGMKPQNYYSRINCLLTGYETYGYLLDENLKVYEFDLETKVCDLFKIKTKTRKVD